jgi:uncharacterized protein DUF262
VISIRRSEISAAYDWFKRRRTIDLAPPFQRRGNLWSVHTKAYLIDSMINGFDIPKLYIADLALLPEGMRTPGTTHAVIDGRQRLETLFEWFDGELKLNQDFIYRRDSSIEAGGLTSPELSQRYPDLAAAAEQFRLDVINVAADSQDEINQLFIRLNQSKPLTGAETRNAMVGTAPIVIRELAKHSFFKENVAFSFQRGGDLNTVAKVLLIESAGEFVDVKRRKLDLFVKDIADEVDKTSLGPVGLKEAAAKVESVFDDMTQVFFPQDPLLHTQGQVPVYYWLVRDVGPADDLREFLGLFEREREENRRLVAEVGATGNIDVELLQYDQLNRSVNDQHSLRGRFEILRRRYG